MRSCCRTSGSDGLGFLFGGIGASIALSPLARVSGGHINPIVSLGYRLAGRLSLKMTGAFLALLAFSFLAKRIEVAKLYHFDSTRDRLFRRKIVTGEKETVVSGT